MSHIRQWRGWSLVAGLAVLAGCAGTYPPGAFIPSVEKPYKITVDDRPAKERVIVRVEVGPRRLKKQSALMAVSRRSGEERELGFFHGSRPKDICMRPSDFTWCDEAKEYFYGFTVEVTYEKLQRYEPVWYLDTPDVDDPRKVTRHEIHDLEPIYAVLDHKTEQIAAEQREAEEAERARREGEKKERIEQELATGKCAQLHARAFEQLLVRQVPVAKRAIEHDGPVDIGPHKLFVATETPEDFEFQAKLGGLYNIFVIGVDDVKVVAAADGSGTPATVASVYEIANLFGSPYLDSRVVRAQPLEKLSLSVAGQGCALLLVMNQVGQ